LIGTKNIVGLKPLNGTVTLFPKGCQFEEVTYSGTFIRKLIYVIVLLEIFIFFLFN